MKKEKLPVRKGEKKEKSTMPPHTVFFQSFFPSFHCRKKKYNLSVIFGFINNIAKKVPSLR